MVRLVFGLEAANILSVCVRERHLGLELERSTLAAVTSDRNVSQI